MTHTEISRDRAESATGDIACMLLTRNDEIDAIAGEWGRLLAASRCNRAFSSHAWYRAACRIYPGIEPCAVVARDGIDIVGILPLAIDAAGCARFPTPLADYSDAIVATPGVAGRMLRYASSSGMPWRRVLLDFIREDCSIAREIGMAGIAVEVEWHRNERWGCAYEALPDGYDGFLAAHSRNFRKGLSRARRAAAEAGLIVEELTPDVLAPEELPGVFMKLHGYRFPGSSLLSGNHREFLEAILPILFAERRMLVFAIRKDERIVAIDLCMVGADGLCTWNGGFDPAIEEWSPGRLLIDAGVRSACAKGRREYDMMRGLEPYKLEWACSRRLLGKMTFAVDHEGMPCC